MIWKDLGGGRSITPVGTWWWSQPAGGAEAAAPRGRAAGPTMGISLSFLQSRWWNAPGIAMEMESVFLELAIVFQDFWVPIVQEVGESHCFSLSPCQEAPATGAIQETAKPGAGHWPRPPDAVVSFGLACGALLTCVVFSPQQPARCCAAATASTPRAAACASAAGRAPSATCPPRSASTRSVGVVGFASWALVLATQGTKEKIAKKVNTVNIYRSLLLSW